MAHGEEWLDKPVPDAIAKVMKARGDAINARLVAGGFETLVPLDGPPNSNGETQPPHFGEITIHADTPGTDDALVVTLGRDKAPPLQTTRVAGYSTGKGETACGYSPRYSATYRDAHSRNLYIVVQMHFNDDCAPPAKVPWIVWPMPSATGATNAAAAPAAGAPATAEIEAITKIVNAQFDHFNDASDDAKLGFAADAIVVGDQGLGTLGRIPDVVVATREVFGGHDDANVAVTLAADGKSAWASGTTTLTLLPRDDASYKAQWRFSDVLAKGATGWKIVAWALTQPMANATANRDAKAGKLQVPTAFTDPNGESKPLDPGDATLRAAFTTLTTDGLDAAAAARSDLVAIGSGPGERTVGGASLAGGWNASWKGKSTISSIVARLAPSGTTGWVAAHVMLAKPGYQLPFTIFAVFDKAPNGWSLVHMHFSVP
jgi:ketosteroid isomerase-like protein